VTRTEPFAIAPSNVRHRLLRLVAVAVFAATPLVAQDVFEAAPWRLHPPLADGPNPSIVASDAPPELVAGEFPLAKTLAVVDGDTLRLDGFRGSIRFLGLDAEETFKDPGKATLAKTNYEEYLKTERAAHAASRRPFKYATPLGHAAKDALEQLLKGVDRVRVEYDDPERMRDGFDRALAHLLVRRGDAWLHLNVELVRQGLSPYFVKYGRCKRYHAAYVAAENEARAKKRGIFGPEEPWRHYGDYEARHKWWAERADALEAAEAARKSRDDVFLLGRADDWERLKKAVGKRVVVVGTLDSYREVGSNPKRGLLSMGHDAKNAFVVIGDVEVARKIGLDKKVAEFEGDLVFVEGVVDVYERTGAPQFMIEGAADAAFFRTPPPLRDGAAASRPDSRAAAPAK
jgi:endonuclease YncB( thermonuclease family)